jgi:hypothetical protein
MKAVGPEELEFTGKYTPESNTECRNDSFFHFSISCIFTLLQMTKNETQNILTNGEIFEKACVSLLSVNFQNLCFYLI